MYVTTDVLLAVVIREEVSNHFPTVTVTLRLHRKPLYYTVNLIVPCCFFSFIALSTFLLQPNSQDRLQIGTYAFLTSIIRPHFMLGVWTAARCYRSSVVCVRVCLLDTAMTCAKTTELISMPFAMCTHWTMYYVGARFLRENGQFLEGDPLRCGLCQNLWPSVDKKITW